jgi:glycosyltransferase involved in cell wall biosynthesis
MEKKVHQRFQEKLNRSTAITYISNYAKSSTHEFFDVPDVPEHIIYNGNPIKDIQLSSVYKPSFVPTRPFLFSIGEFTQRKNFKTLVEMLRMLPEYDLVIAGKNTTKSAEDIRALIRSYNLENRVKLPGKISELDKQWYLQNCRAFVFPSLREGFGLPVIEAMRFGKPVITSNNTSLPEIGGDIAFYWEHFDPEYMAQIVNESIHTFDTNLKENTSKSITHAQSFNWKNAAQSYIDVYRNILNS